MVSKGWLQIRLSDLLNNMKNLNKIQGEGYKATILSYKSTLHNTSEDNINSFCDKVFDEENRRKQSNFWTDFQFGKSKALDDIINIIKETY